jgi:crossover junction endodeoxyribonuclease RuvC
MVIMGLDPGSLNTGYGLVAAQNSQITLVAQGVIAAPGTWAFPQRLAHIHLGLLKIIEEFKPQGLAVENVFTHKNPASAFKLAQARGVAILAAALKEIPVFEYTPSQIKNAVVGHGRAEKSQVAFMVKSVLRINEELAPDASDALAAAICHAGQKTLLALGTAAKPQKSAKSSTKWSSLSVEDLAARGFKVAKP